MRCGPDWLWTYNGRLLWMDGMLYLTAFGHGLDCQTISLTGQSVKFYRVSWIYEHLSVGVCLSQRIFWRVYFEEHSSLQWLMLRGFPPSGEVPTSVPVVDWVKLLSGQYVAGLTDQSGMLQFVELYRTRK